MYDVLKQILVADLHLREQDVLPTAGREEVGLDSLAVLELAELVNGRFGIDVRDYELMEAATLADVANLLEERRAAAEIAGGRP